MRTRYPLCEGLKLLTANPNQGQMAKCPLPDPEKCGNETQPRENGRQPEADHGGGAWVDHTWDKGSYVVQVRRFPGMSRQEG